MSEILNEFNDDTQESSRGALFYFRAVLLVVVVIGFGIYVGDLLFGKSSLDVLLNLQTDKEILETKVFNFKEENAILQKEYFELKELDPDSKGE